MTQLGLRTYHHGMRTQTVNIEETKAQLSDLIATAQQGGEVVIVENGKALARLIPATDGAVYESHPPTLAEFTTDEEKLAWDANGWENVG